MKGSLSVSPLRNSLLNSEVLETVTGCFKNLGHLADDHVEHAMGYRHVHAKCKNPCSLVFKR